MLDQDNPQSLPITEEDVTEHLSAAEEKFEYWRRRVGLLLGPALCVPLGVTGQANVIAPFASPSIFMFIGSFFIAAAMHVHGLDRRMALWLLTKPGVTCAQVAARTA